MFGGIGSALVGAAGSIAGGLLGNASRDTYVPPDHFWDNVQLQKDFAQQGIRWKVADAKAAGLHPLAALGAQTSSFSPVYAGDSGYSTQNDYSFLGETGQQIGRAIDAKSTEEERARNRVYQEKANELQLENMQLQNDAIKQDMVRQLARDAERAVNTQQRTPAMPIFRTRADGATLMAGQGDASSSALFKVEPPELIASHPQTPYAEAGTHAEVKFTRTSDGGYAPVRSQAMEEALEDDFLGSAAWNLRNRLSATAYDDLSGSPPSSYLPSRDWTWTFNPVKQAYYPVRRSDWLGRVGKRFNPF